MELNTKLIFIMPWYNNYKFYLILSFSLFASFLFKKIAIYVFANYILPLHVPLFRYLRFSIFFSFIFISSSTWSRLDSRTVDRA